MICDPFPIFMKVDFIRWYQDHGNDLEADNYVFQSYLVLKLRNITVQSFNLAKKTIKNSIYPMPSDGELAAAKGAKQMRFKVVKEVPVVFLQIRVSGQRPLGGTQPLQSSVAAT